MTVDPKRVSAARYQEMRDRAETAEQRVAQLEYALDDARRGAAADIERLAAPAATERDELQVEVQRWRRFDLIRQAASRALFIDPQDAVARLAEHDHIADMDAAALAVQALADDAPHLIRQPAAAVRLAAVSTPLHRTPTQGDIR